MLTPKRGPIGVGHYRKAAGRGHGVRLVHYEHKPYFYGLCDRNGLLIWTELSIINHVHDTEGFRQNARQQLTELIRQNYKHPGIVMWSLYNEVNNDSPADPRCSCCGN